MNKIYRDFIFDQSDMQSWRIINDSVMGGLSTGNTVQKAQSICFFGRVKIENNGGFTSSYRKLPPLDKQLNAVAIDIDGDGNSYQLRMRTVVSNTLLDPQSVYKIDFQTIVGKRQQLLFKLADFSASLRGKIITDAPALKAENITEIGFLIAPKCEKVFSLDVYQVKFLHL
ncbi:CIA30 family protein [Psychromonas sp. psych-6C06]|uniref:CIA30 family protein n=1 Tax=Psychromonas sp. psych-6C06 TaxID=2058089 RepID=UPI000C34FADC|nr:CIA30 family protein [Psychromonas sp. psych-6C06]PKF62658.1 CIA30 family protein [Psychromonas sp. psych-6C06]